MTTSDFLDSVIVDEDITIPAELMAELDSQLQGLEKPPFDYWKTSDYQPL